jgi:uncharacterized membrane protein
VQHLGLFRAGLAGQFEIYSRSIRARLERLWNAGFALSMQDIAHFRIMLADSGSHVIRISSGNRKNRKSVHRGGNRRPIISRSAAT